MTDTWKGFIQELLILLTNDAKLVKKINLYWKNFVEHGLNEQSWDKQTNLKNTNIFWFLSNIIIREKKQTLLKSLPVLRKKGPTNWFQ